MKRTVIAPRTVTRANGALVAHIRVGAVDIGRENPALWIGQVRRHPATGVAYVGFDEWAHAPLPAGTATQQQGELVARVLGTPGAAAVTDWMVEQQKPVNHATGGAENVSAYGLQSALVGALCAVSERADATPPPSALGARHVFVRSPKHKFGVLGVDKRLIAKKAERKRRVRRIADAYVRDYLPTDGEAARRWRAAAPKQDDMADAFLSGVCYLLELDARAKQPQLTPLLEALRRYAQT